MPGGVVHKLPADLRKALIANIAALDAWKDITPLARNEFICWIEDANPTQCEPLCAPRWRQDVAWATRIRCHYVASGPCERERR